MTSEQLGSWHSPSYVAQWAAEDVVADMLELPRRISVALVADAGIPVRHVVDLGAGPGGYLRHFLAAFPAARATWVDSSEPMRDAAREQLAEFGDRIDYVLADVEDLAGIGLERVDVLMTSRVLHHFSAASIQRLYRAAYELVVPGGFVFDLDHVGVPADWKARYKRVRDQLTGGRRRAIRPHRHDHPLRSMDGLLHDAAAAGFVDPDVPWRTLYTALVAARRPDGT
jgi:SAM-dependent methyltransferase